ncbi:hypothetical protein P9112_014003 [Eukaryota sp. TZLM1-RC]
MISIGVLRELIHTVLPVIHTVVDDRLSHCVSTLILLVLALVCLFDVLFRVGVDFSHLWFYPAILVAFLHVTGFSLYFFDIARPSLLLASLLLFYYGTLNVFFYGWSLSKLKAQFVFLTMTFNLIFSILLALKNFSHLEILQGLVSASVIGCLFISYQTFKFYNNPSETLKFTCFSSNECNCQRCRVKVD